MSQPRTAKPAPLLAEPEDGERRWLREVRVAEPRQLTARAVVAGMAIGAVMCLSNLYVFFKTGWSMGVTITAAILAFALFRALRGAGIVKRR
jgi:uncharacterized oligopeptide transporter (OPT) family protein